MVMFFRNNIIIFPARVLFSEMAVIPACVAICEVDTAWAFYLTSSYYI